MAITKNDLENYRKCSEPHQSKEEADKALEGFYEAISEARKKFKISDALVVVQDNFIHDDEEREVFSLVQFGHSARGNEREAGRNDAQSRFEEMTTENLGR